MSKKAFLFAALALILAFGFSVEANAQHPLRPVKQLGRWLGDGLGNGYHWQRKGPDICYYNPYSALNSQLITSQKSNPMILENFNFGQPATQGDPYPAIFDPSSLEAPDIREPRGIELRDRQRLEIQNPNQPDDPPVPGEIQPDSRIDRIR